VVTIDAPADESLVAKADSQHVIQVLVNLVINAEESVAKQDVRTVRIRLWRDSGAVHVEFVDSGAGFDAAIEPRVGQPFLTTKDGGAAGLGLAVAKRLVEADGGRLAIAASPAVVTASWPDTV
jgi:C4-dicarboxylate-specific signal transduction histidine kinase